MSLELVTFESSPDQFTGLWQPVFYKPDLASPQRYLVGIVALQNNQVKASRLITDFRKLECIYGERLRADMMRHFFDRLRDQLRAAEKSRFDFNPSEYLPQVILGEPMFATGESAAALADDLFKTLVVLQPTEQETTVNAKRKFQVRDTETVRRTVNFELKKLLGLKYEKVVEERGYIDHREGDVIHRLNINLKTGTACGSVISAWYSTAASVEAQLLRAEVDLYKARDLYNCKRLGLFIQRPYKPVGVAQEELNAIDGLIDDAAWRFSGPNKVDIHENAADLAQSIAGYMT